MTTQTIELTADRIQEIDKVVGGVVAKAKGLSPTGSLDKYQIQRLFEVGRIGKEAYIQLAFEFDYPNQQLAFEDDDAEIFAGRWSLEDKAHQIDTIDVWKAIAKYLSKECDKGSVPTPQLSLFDQPQNPPLDLGEF